MISEIKLDAAFPANQFSFKDRFGRNDKVEGDNLICQRFHYHFFFKSVFFPSVLWGILDRVKPLKEERFFFCIFNLHNRYIKDHLKELGKPVELYSKTYENVIIMGDFNAEIS